ncbi:group III truncated hemoglobin [Pedobacter changchengzhani]|uniref:Group III truncated hemoglobin n=1 Tax=Pedobacter changchengzhani TaxID=2529274 RepID=A0A4R5MJW5_9SPHI|nr:group III truncated hemoglobin [Pedobacter changchengzhani]TDG35901.1 group III truncated hemoglobin [Pedobacter changchengzhani]
MARKKDIEGLDDIMLFVNQFYGKVQKDDLIGEIFNNVILDWTPHLEKMYSFWNAVLFGVAGFVGNPFAKHAPLPISEEHFERWISLFYATIDENFEGEMAVNTKKRAETMALMFLSKLKAMRGGSSRVIV